MRVLFQSFHGYVPRSAKWGNGRDFGLCSSYHELQALLRSRLTLPDLCELASSVGGAALMKPSAEVFANFVIWLSSGTRTGAASHRRGG